MAATKKINIAELDFDAIKANLKEFLRTQDTFKDYDFEGAGLSIILDILSYNTHYNALYDNLAVNEMFLDSAVKRNSVVSIAKSLGYTPRSAKCAKAIISMQGEMVVGANGAAIARNTPFTATYDSQTYTFYNSEAIIIPANTSGNAYTVTDINLVAGVIMSYRFRAADSRFILPNANIDLDTITVRVQEQNTSTFITYNQATTIVNADPTTKVYWVKELDDGLYELIFGDGVIGKKLEPSDTIEVRYFVSEKEAPNGAAVFKFGGNLAANNLSTDPECRVTQAAVGGAAVEDIPSIKFNAPRMYAAQNRAVTTDDYRTIIYNQFPEAKSVSVWGGEDNSPPVYGKTFICVRPRSTERLSNQQKDDIKISILANKNVVSVIPEIVDPEYLSLGIDCTVYYNPRDTTRSPSEISALAREAIVTYDETELQRFDGVFRLSKLSRMLDDIEISVVSSTTSLVIRRSIQPRFNVSAQYILDIINPIYTLGLPQGAIFTNGFYINGSVEVHYLDDDGAGNMRLYYIGGANEVVMVNAKIGTVDYASGKINIKNLNIRDLRDADLVMTIKPASYDVVSAYTQIVEIDQSRIAVRAIPDEASTGDLRAGKNYTFTPSRT